MSFKPFVLAFISHRNVQWMTLFCLLLELFKSGSLIHSLGVLTLLFLIYFGLCYLLFTGNKLNIQQKQCRLCKQYSPKRKA